VAGGAVRLIQTPEPFGERDRVGIPGGDDAVARRRLRASSPALLSAEANAPSRFVQPSEERLGENIAGGRDVLGHLPPAPWANGPVARHIARCQVERVLRRQR